MPTVEERLAAVEARLAGVESYMEHVATKADIAEMKSDLMAELTWRTFGMVVGMFVAVASAVAVVQAVFD